MSFGDAKALQDFAFVHRLSHADNSKAIQLAGGPALPSATIDNHTAMDAWAKAMAQIDLSATERLALSDWMQLHTNLHQAEFDALNLGESVDLSQADFSQDASFYDWMAAHAFVHDQIGNALGTT